jgi:hypothetical protein
MQTVDLQTLELAISESNRGYDVSALVDIGDGNLYDFMGYRYEAGELIPQSEQVTAFYIRNCLEVDAVVLKKLYSLASQLPSTLWNAGSGIVCRKRFFPCIGRQMQWSEYVSLLSDANIVLHRDTTSMATRDFDAVHIHFNEQTFEADFSWENNVDVLICMTEAGRIAGVYVHDATLRMHTLVSDERGGNGAMWRMKELVNGSDEFRIGLYQMQLGESGSMQPTSTVCCVSNKLPQAVRDEGVQAAWQLSSPYMEQAGRQFWADPQLPMTRTGLEGTAWLDDERKAQRLAVPAVLQQFGVHTLAAHLPDADVGKLQLLELALARHAFPFPMLERRVVPSPVVIHLAWHPGGYPAPASQPDLQRQPGGAMGQELISAIRSEYMESVRFFHFPACHFAESLTACTFTENDVEDAPACQEQMWLKCDLKMEDDNDIHLDEASSNFENSAEQAVVTWAPCGFDLPSNPVVCIRSSGLSRQRWRSVAPLEGYHQHMMSAIVQHALRDIQADGNRRHAVIDLNPASRRLLTLYAACFFIALKTKPATFGIETSSRVSIPGRVVVVCSDAEFELLKHLAPLYPFSADIFSAEMVQHLLTATGLGETDVVLLYPDHELGTGPPPLITVQFASSALQVMPLECVDLVYSGAAARTQLWRRVKIHSFNVCNGTEARAPFPREFKIKCIKVLMEARIARDATRELIIHSDDPDLSRTCFPWNDKVVSTRTTADLMHSYVSCNDLVAIQPTPDKLETLYTLLVGRRQLMEKGLTVYAIFFENKSGVDAEDEKHVDEVIRSALFSRNVPPRCKHVARYRCQERVGAENKFVCEVNACSSILTAAPTDAPAPTNTLALTVASSPALTVASSPALTVASSPALTVASSPTLTDAPVSALTDAPVSALTDAPVSAPVPALELEHEHEPHMNVQWIDKLKQASNLKDLISGDEDKDESCDDFLYVARWKSEVEEDAKAIQMCCATTKTQYSTRSRDDLSRQDWNDIEKLLHTGASGRRFLDKDMSEFKGLSKGVSYSINDVSGSKKNSVWLDYAQRLTPRTWQLAIVKYVRDLYFEPERPGARVLYGADPGLGVILYAMMATCWVQLADRKGVAAVVLMFPGPLELVNAARELRAFEWMPPFEILGNAEPLSGASDAVPKKCVPGRVYLLSISDMRVPNGEFLEGMQTAHIIVDCLDRVCRLTHAPGASHDTDLSLQRSENARKWLNWLQRAEELKSLFVHTESFDIIERECIIPLETFKFLYHTHLLDKTVRKLGPITVISTGGECAAFLVNESFVDTVVRMLKEKQKAGGRTTLSTAAPQQTATGIGGNIEAVQAQRVVVYLTKANDVKDLFQKFAQAPTRETLSDSLVMCIANKFVGVDKTLYVCEQPLLEGAKLVTVTQLGVLMHGIRNIFAQTAKRNTAFEERRQLVLIVCPEDKYDIDCSIADVLLRVPMKDKEQELQLRRRVSRPCRKRKLPVEHIMLNASGCNLNETKTHITQIKETEESFLKNAQKNLDWGIPYEQTMQNVYEADLVAVKNADKQSEDVDQQSGDANKQSGNADQQSGNTDGYSTADEDEMTNAEWMNKT